MPNFRRSGQRWGIDHENRLFCREAGSKFKTWIDADDPQVRLIDA